ncbi:hypothetical protein BKG97_04995 [Rodentibacter caecimuris]|nr:hypothetical protein BKG97_04995 [Rodentibacter heylii]
MKEKIMWDKEVLSQIDIADDLKIAPFRPDGQTTGTPTWIWAVIVEGRLFVRAYNGVHSSWYQAAIRQQAGKIYAINRVFDVVFNSIKDSQLNEKIDQAYRKKYASSRYVSHMIGDNCRAATIEILVK